MLDATYLAMLRRILNDVDEAAQRFTDAELWGCTGDVALEFQVRGVTNYGSYTVTPDGVSPEFSDDDGFVTMYQVACQLLTELYNAKVSQGELGGSWKSGLEEESTSTNQRAYAEALAGLDRKVTEFKLLRAKRLFATRPQ